MRGVAPIQAAHADALGRLVGRRLTGAAVVQFVEDDSWYAECPVVLDFDGVQVEICHQKFDDLSITFNTIDCGAPITGWEESEFTPVWRFDDDRIIGYRDQVLRRVALLEWRAPGDMADGMVAVEFTFAGGRFAIANGLDENMIEVGERLPEYHGHVVASYDR